MYECRVIQYPSGRWGFVGSVPAILAYVGGSKEILDVIAHCGPGIARKIAAKRGVEMPKEATWPTKADALSFARLYAHEAVVTEKSWEE